jgi:p-hydroxybenzoate 3-monooxygenase
MDREAQVHEGFQIAWNGILHRTDLKAVTGGITVLVYGQTEVTRDLYDGRDALGGMVIHHAEDVEPHDIETQTPYVSRPRGVTARLRLRHGMRWLAWRKPSGAPQKNNQIREFERVYPFGWLGVLTRTWPGSSELIYARHETGFALCSLRSLAMNRYYIQVPLTDSTDDWPEDRRGTGKADTQVAAETA